MALSLRGLAVLIAVIKCKGTVVEGSCKSVPPADGSSGTKAAVTSQVNEGLCKYIPNMTEDKMRQQCSDFCQIGGREMALPLFMGSSSFGFSQSDFDKVCLNTADTSILEKNETKKATCKTKGQAIRRIQESSANFLAAVDVLKSEQTAFKAVIEEKTAALQELLASPVFKDRMDEAPDKAGTLKEQFTNWKAQVSGSAVNDLNKAMNDLKTRGSELETSVNGNLAQFTDFLAECGLLLAALSADGYYMMDVCAQGNAECLEHEQSLHVGCCCAINPLALDSNYDVDGMTADGLGKLSVEERRRLQDAEGAEIFHVCTESKRRAKESLNLSNFDGRLAEVKGGAKVLENAKQELEKEYSAYAAQCGGSKAFRRLAGDEQGAATQAQSNTSATQARSLQTQVLSCIPPKSESGALKVAFSEKLLDGICKKQEPVIDDVAMQESCSKFCHPYGVPILMGSDSFGFGLPDVEQLVLSTQNDTDGTPGVLTYAPELYGNCMDWAQAFNRIEVQAARFVKSLEVFTAAKNLYLAEVRSTVNELQAYMQTQAFTKMMDEATDKMASFQKVIRERVQDRLSSTTTPAFVTLGSAKDGLRKAAEKLQETIAPNLRDLEKFVDQCNAIFVGVGSKNEYLLDICAQQSTACIDEDARNVGHVSCACAFNPVVTLGTSITFPIDGVSDPTAVSRRLQDSDEHTLIDICALAWEDAFDEVSSINQQIVDMGQQKVLDVFLDRLIDAYGSDYCGFLGSGATTTTGTIDRDMMNGSPYGACASTLVAALLLTCQFLIVQSTSQQLRR